MTAVKARTKSLEGRIEDFCVANRNSYESVENITALREILRNLQDEDERRLSTLIGVSQQQQHSSLDDSVEIQRLIINASKSRIDKEFDAKVAESSEMMQSDVSGSKVLSFEAISAIVYEIKLIIANFQEFSRIEFSKEDIGDENEEKKKEKQLGGLKGVIESLRRLCDGKDQLNDIMPIYESQLRFHLTRVFGISDSFEQFFNSLRNAFFSTALVSILSIEVWHNFFHGIFERRMIREVRKVLQYSATRFNMLLIKSMYILERLLKHPMQKANIRSTDELEKNLKNMCKVSLPDSNSVESGLVESKEEFVEENDKRIDDKKEEEIEDESQHMNADQLLRHLIVLVKSSAASKENERDFISNLDLDSSIIVNLEAKTEDFGGDLKDSCDLGPAFQSASKLLQFDKAIQDILETIRESDTKHFESFSALFERITTKHEEDTLQLNRAVLADAMTNRLIFSVGLPSNILKHYNNSIKEIELECQSIEQWQSIVNAGQQHSCVILMEQIADLYNLMQQFFESKTEHDLTLSGKMIQEFFRRISMIFLSKTAGTNTKDAKRCHMPQEVLKILEELRKDATGIFNKKIEELREPQAMKYRVDNERWSFMAHLGEKIKSLQDLAIIKCEIAKKFQDLAANLVLVNTNQDRSHNIEVSKSFCEMLTLGRMLVINGSRNINNLLEILEDLLELLGQRNISRLHQESIYDTILNSTCQTLDDIIKTQNLAEACGNVGISRSEENAKFFEDSQVEIELEMLDQYVSTIRGFMLNFVITLFDCTNLGVQQEIILRIRSLSSKLINYFDFTMQNSFSIKKTKEKLVEYFRLIIENISVNNLDESRILLNRLRSSDDAQSKLLALDQLILDLYSLISKAQDFFSAECDEDDDEDWKSRFENNSEKHNLSKPIEIIETLWKLKSILGRLEETFAFTMTIEDGGQMLICSIAEKCIDILQIGDYSNRERREFGHELCEEMHQILFEFNIFQSTTNNQAIDLSLESQSDLKTDLKTKKADNIKDSKIVNNLEELKRTLNYLIRMHESHNDSALVNNTSDVILEIDQTIAEQLKEKLDSISDLFQRNIFELKDEMWNELKTQNLEVSALVITPPKSQESAGLKHHEKGKTKIMHDIIVNFFKNQMEILLGISSLKSRDSKINEMNLENLKNCSKDICLKSKLSRFVAEIDEQVLNDLIECLNRLSNTSDHHQQQTAEQLVGNYESLYKIKDLLDNLRIALDGLHWRLNCQDESKVLQNCDVESFGEYLEDLCKTLAFLLQQLINGENNEEDCKKLSDSKQQLVNNLSSLFCQLMECKLIGANNVESHKDLLDINKYFNGAKNNLETIRILVESDAKNQSAFFFQLIATITELLRKLHKNKLFEEKCEKLSIEVTSELLATCNEFETQLSTSLDRNSNSAIKTLHKLYEMIISDDLRDKKQLRDNFSKFIVDMRNYLMKNKFKDYNRYIIGLKHSSKAFRKFLLTLEELKDKKRDLKSQKPIDRNLKDFTKNKMKDDKIKEKEAAATTQVDDKTQNESPSTIGLVDINFLDPNESEKNLELIEKATEKTRQLMNEKIVSLEEQLAKRTSRLAKACPKYLQLTLRVVELCLKLLEEQKETLAFCEKRAKNSLRFHNFQNYLIRVLNGLNKLKTLFVMSIPGGEIGDCNFLMLTRDATVQLIEKLVRIQDSYKILKLTVPRYFEIFVKRSKELMEALLELEALLKDAKIVQSFVDLLSLVEPGIKYEEVEQECKLSSINTLIRHFTLMGDLGECGKETNEFLFRENLQQ